MLERKAGEGGLYVNLEKHEKGWEQKMKLDQGNSDIQHEKQKEDAIAGKSMVQRAWVCPVGKVWVGGEDGGGYPTSSTF